MSRVVALLGRISCESASVDDSKSVPNSTRWVLDVHQEPGALTLNLLTRNRVKVNASVLSFSAVPLDSVFYQSGFRISDIEGSAFNVHCKVGTSYRLTIDTVSSLVH